MAEAGTCDYLIKLKVVQVHDTGTSINMFRVFYPSKHFNILLLIPCPIRAPPGATFFLHRNPGVDLPDGLHQRRRPGQPRYVGRHFLLRLERPVVLGTCEQP